ncbi:NnrU family protein [Halovulum dunhuangense]|uniref:NnrU family protein n=1 Tax=Halovulum dunhuangense TaxID=1505036 RepID=A0A849KV59_9RHOB|nr:NnrU family protein [Halovulum dunhuangense]NNU78925.1 NnrU family protein [Halovulum dunhuangense]
MTLLVIGVALWWGAHLFKRLAPAQRAALSARMGDKSKAIFATLLLLSVVLMVLGYRGADFVAVWTPPAAMLHVNNLLMLLAVIFFGMASSKGRMRSWLRHPMLTGFLAWAVAHLLVNGDLASIILFGGLGLWAPVAMVAINRGNPAWTPPAPGPVKGDVRLVLISVVVFAVLGGIHSLLGPWPFPG